MTAKETLLEQIKTILPTLHGWCSFEKATALVENILEHRPGLCVEVGVFGGSSLIPQALALKHNGKGRIVGIDPWATDAALEEMIATEHKDWWTKVNLEEILRHCQDNIRSAGVGGQAGLIRGKAQDVVDQFDDGSIDLLHIDGNHSEALSCKDATLYLPKVKPGGFVFFDDIWWAEARDGEAPRVTTRKAVLFLLGECRRVGLVGDCMILEKHGLAKKPGGG